MKIIKGILVTAALTLSLEALGIAPHAAAAFPVSTDPMRVKQSYLDMIHLPEAWAAAGDTSQPLIVAVVDTGVDLTHPDLAANLVEGVNLLEPGAKPLDDNGHGTNVAGIIAAVVNNDKGIAGMAPNARIMPIKALEADGTGGEAKLGEGIRYAVDHGARIVVLSLGLNKNTSALAQTVQYAEDHGVLLVAAVGNEGSSVKYPAAYPTVLGVGGVSDDKTPDYRSNFGPELDLVAPWEVFTTALGGGYEYKDGSSMSAPQVAAAAALVWGKYPGLTPYQVRDMLLQTAEDLGTPGWDAHTGAGLLRVDRALTTALSEDRFEPNNSQNQAAKLSVSTSVHASLSSAQDQDWFAIDAPYEGTLVLHLTPQQGASVTVRNDAGVFYRTDGKSPISFRVRKGRNYIQLTTTDRTRAARLDYALRTSFEIYRDPFEDNDKQYQAFVLPDRSQTVRGTFDKPNDQDWFMLPLAQSGTLRIKCTVDTGRIDPVLLIQKKGEKSITIDQGGDGALEISSLMEVLPGDYYIRVSNIKDYIEPVTGEYILSIEYTPKLVDPNEPNDKSYQSTFMGLSSAYEGLFHTNDDTDWFQFRLGRDSLAQISLTNIPVARTLTATLYDSSLKEQGVFKNGSGQTSLYVEKPLPSGTYFIKLQTDKWFLNQMYRLQTDAPSLVGGFIDIDGHWAEASIVDLTSRGVLSGYGNYRFAPERPITRAEAITALVRGLQLTKEKAISYSDLPASHWAYAYIAKAQQAGLVSGYPDGRFQPDRPLTRMEMTQLLAKSMNMSGKKRGNSPFTDIGDGYWGIGIVKQMFADGWISGYPDGTFRPDAQASRAEFVTLLTKVLHR
ncbi:S8 family serine peptidase [Paenibacillus athensensis]|uniref:Peptidase S8 n=1 Tax=Paenibacillus athensensis TaxID=1967502 RepID=A0A4Y8Q5M1_9BACL|nr:S8 family serine peptidase [Paenibacillus athensensis]MCD1260879.1 S8 family serine peptidase [Paenibacillus athensensis]